MSKFSIEKFFRQCNFRRISPKIQFLAKNFFIYKRRLFLSFQELMEFSIFCHLCFQMP
ncbi:hypothetical protein ROSINTL182_07833 [Roseburia intestinalis L1-82]|uniref:Uncharacterized protein n=1 Tax=Roseburia intestinalis L1-82 TaxID=536231 RepID=C7GD33_9FIRM|nr:hypothetical protein ROSINTL182_07833 [Roseburia intestinalis L1-82]